MKAQSYFRRIRHRNSTAEAGHLRSQHQSVLTDRPAVSSRRLVAALVTWLIVSSLSAGALLVLQPIIGPDPEVLSLVMLAPAIGTGPAWVVLRGRGVFIFRRAGPSALVAACAVSFGVIAVYFAVISFVRGNGPDLPAEVAGVPLILFVLLQVLGALTEELGYRGFLLHVLYRWLPRLPAAVIVGVMFGMWHVQYFGLPVMEFLAFFLGTVALTLTMAYLMVGSFWQRMAVCTLIHLGANLALAFVGTDDISMFTYSTAIILGSLIAFGGAYIFRSKLTHTNERR